MIETESPVIVFSEWLATGVIVHFAGSLSVFYPAGFLHSHRNQQLAWSTQAGEHPPELEDGVLRNV